LSAGIKRKDGKQRVQNLFKAQLRHLATYYYSARVKRRRAFFFQMSIKFS